MVRETTAGADALRMMMIISAARRRAAMERRSSSMPKAARPKNPTPGQRCIRVSLFFPETFSLIQCPHYLFHLIVYRVSIY